MKKMAHRLKIRLALANFKRQHGYEKYDLHTLESSILFQPKNTKRGKSVSTTTRNTGYYSRYYKTMTAEPLGSSSTPTNSSSGIARAASSDTPPFLLRSRLSAKRSTSPRRHRSPTITTSSNRQYSPLSSSQSSADSAVRSNALSSDEEDAANLLVMLHNDSGVSSSC